MTILKVLVIDDEAGIRESVKRALSKLTVNLPYVEDEFSFEIHTAPNAEEGMEMMQRTEYSILLLDNQLPGMNGTELLEKMHNSGMEMLTVMITAFASIETAVAATKHGAYDFLTKPFTPQELKDSVHKAAKHFILTSTARKLSEEKKKIRFQFISVLSHELKSPIAAVSNYLKLMEKKIAGSDISAYGEFIKRSQIRIKDMEKLIYDLLDLTRIESGEKKRELAVTDFSEVVKETIENLSEDIRKKNISVKFEPAVTEMTADRTELGIIASNLISNAVKYNRDGGTVSIYLTKEGKDIKFSVSDTGIGIDEKDIGRLFKEFSRIRTEETASISGSGIGLSTVKKIAALYGGTVSASSEKGKGSLFEVILKNEG